MKKTYLALAFFITGFLLAGNAYGEDEVYYCAETKSNGFHYLKDRGSYTPSIFIEIKFKIKLNRTSNALELVPEDSSRKKFTCEDPFFNGILSCHSGFNHFSFNPISGRFLYFRGYGYVGGDHDSVMTGHGKCDKF